MSDKPNRAPGAAQDAISDLLARAQPRTPPPADTRERAYRQLHVHWAQRQQRRTIRRRMVGMGVAASALLTVGIYVTTDTWQREPTTVAVAGVIRTSGAGVRVREDQSDRWAPADASKAIKVNQTLRTGSGSRAALAWGNGGSLRADQNTEMQFLSDEHIRLIAGTIYFDSMPGETPLPTKPLVIETPQGRVTHLGTQFTTRVQDGRVVISVREGEVSLNGSRFDAVVARGEELSVERNGFSAKRPITPYSQQWQWVQEIAPAFDSEGATPAILLAWIGRETGYTIDYTTPGAATVANDQTLFGIGPLLPGSALRAVTVGADLRYEVTDGSIQISEMAAPK